MLYSVDSDININKSLTLLIVRALLDDPTTY